MKSLVVSLISEINNLENELVVLLKQSSNFEDDRTLESELVESCVDSLRSRLTSIMVIFSRMLENKDDIEAVTLSNGSALSGEEIIVTTMSTMFLNLFLRIALKCNCNLSATKVLLRRLSDDTYEESSIQRTMEGLVDKLLNDLDG